MEHRENKQVKRAGFSYIGHYDLSELVIYFDNCCVKLSPTHKQLYKLFSIFDIESENRAYFEDITGKYCVVVYDEDKIVALEHLVKDIRWDIE